MAETYLPPREFAASRCSEGVSRGGEYQPCDKVAVGIRIDPDDASPYSVCAYHARGEMMPLVDIMAAFRAFLSDERLAEDGAQ